MDKAFKKLLKIAKKSSIKHKGKNSIDKSSKKHHSNKSKIKQDLSALDTEATNFTKNLKNVSKGQWVDKAQECIKKETKKISKMAE